MNIEYIKKLLEYNRYGRVMQLLRDNIHTWSMDDYIKVYWLCHGYRFVSQCYTIYNGINKLCDSYRYDSKYFSDTCIIYIYDNIPDDIQKYAVQYYIENKISRKVNTLWLVTGSIRLHKNNIANNRWINEQNKTEHDEYMLHDDAIVYIIKTRTLNVYFYKNIERIAGRLSKYIAYNDSDINVMVSKIQNANIYFDIHNLYADGKYNIGQQMFDTLNALKLTIHMNNYVMRDIQKFKYLWKSIRDNDVKTFCKYFVDHEFTGFDIFFIQKFLTQNKRYFARFNKSVSHDYKHYGMILKSCIFNKI